jgi:hypothetical protein
MRSPPFRLSIFEIFAGLCVYQPYSAGELKAHIVRHLPELTAQMLVILYGLHTGKPLLAPAFASDSRKSFSRAGVGIAFAIAIFVYIE